MFRGKSFGMFGRTKGMGKGGVVSMSEVTPHIIFQDGFESGNLSAWSGSSTGGSNILSVSGSAALASTNYGLQCAINDTTAIYCTYSLSSPNTLGVVRARFYFDPNSLSMGSGEEFSLLVLMNGSAANIAIVSLAYVTSIYRIRTYIYNDGGTGTQATYSVTDAPHYVEACLIRATDADDSNGSLQCWIDGVNQGTTINIDNYDKFNNFNQVRLGAVVGIDAGTSGILFLDELVISDNEGEIGAI